MDLQVYTKDWIKIIDNFLTEDECLELINSVEDKLSSASVLGQEIDGYRVATTAWINNVTPLVNKIQTFLSKETNSPIENQENLHIVKYDMGGQYKDHQDFFHPDEDYYEEEMKYGGQRVFTCLIYLNEDFIGGDTYFPNRKFMINPKIGRLVIWRNLTEDNHLDYDSLHAGLPVDIGEKLIALVWIRENKFK